MTPSTRPQRTHLKNGNPREYHYFNALIFFNVLALLLAAKLNWFSVRCVYAEKGISCKTCGLTRAFQDILNGNFSAVNPAFLMLFLLIGGQLVLRPLVSLLLLVNKRQAIIRYIDILVSIAVFIVFLMLLLGKG